VCRGTSDKNLAFYGQVDEKGISKRVLLSQLAPDVNWVARFLSSPNIGPLIRRTGPGPALNLKRKPMMMSRFRSFFLNSRSGLVLGVVLALRVSA
jgi:hypothetical protein